jgi:phasin family protein
MGRRALVLVLWMPLIGFLMAVGLVAALGRDLDGRYADFGDAATSSAHTLATSLQTIASAHADFLKKLMEHNSEYISQLTSVKEPGKLMELQSEYMKKAHETFVAESKRISELYAGFFKQMTKPLEDLIEKNKAA